MDGPLCRDGGGGGGGAGGGGSYVGMSGAKGSGFSNSFGRKLRLDFNTLV